MTTQLAAQLRDLSARYEALRAHALGIAPVAFVPLGLGILRQRGLVAWMVKESIVQQPGASLVESAADDGLGHASAASSELVRVLVGTVFLLAKGERT